MTLLEELAAEGVNTGEHGTLTHSQSVAKSICFSEECRQKKSAVEIVVNHLDDDPVFGSEVIAWLRRYRLVNVNLLLQTYIYTRNEGMFEVCGTQDLERDTRIYLGLPELAETNDKNDKNDKEKYSGPVLDVEIKLTAKRNAEIQLPAKKRDTSTKLLGVNTADINQVAGILTSYSSAIEASKKIVQIGGDHDKTAETVCEQCYKSSPYNRFYGSLVMNLLKSNESIWTESFSKQLDALFTTVSDTLDTDQLQTIGTFYGHVMSSISNWEPFLEMTSLAPSVSTPSNRILFMALLTELKQELGEAEVERRIKQLKIKQLVEGQLAAKFWKVAALNVSK